MSLCQASRESKGLADILFFQIRKIREQIGDGTTGSESLNDHANSDPHSPNTGLPAHHVGIHRNSVKSLHSVIIAHDWASAVGSPVAVSGPSSELGDPRALSVLIVP